MILNSEILCFNDNIGSITLTATGGIPPYSYKIVGNPFVDDPTFDGLTAGEYTFRVRDAEFTIVDIPYTLSNPEEIIGSVNVVNNQAIILASGGTGELQYAIDNGSFQSSNVFGNLENGDYTFTVQDDNGCSITLMASVNIEPLLGESELFPSISCFGESDATITLTANGGVGPYQYSIDGTTFQDSPVFEGLGAGTYQPVITDSVGQSFELSEVVINNPSELTATVLVVGPTLIVNPIGGTGDYMYSFDNNPFQDANSFDIGINGIYPIVIMDTNGCSIGIEAEVNMPTDLDFSYTDVLCFGEASGTVTINEVIDGIGPFQFALNGGMFSANTTFSGLTAGDYQILVSDDNGFVWDGPTFTIIEPEEILVSTNQDAIILQLMLLEVLEYFNIQLETATFKQVTNFSNYLVESMKLL